MKKIEKKYIFGALGIILVIVLTSEITYLSIKNKTDNKEPSSGVLKDPDKPQPQEPNTPIEPNKPEENITLSNQELEKYLSYIPYYNQTDNAYVSKLKDYQTIDKDFLKIAIINSIQECFDNDEIKCPFNHSTPKKIKAKMKYYEGDETPNYIPLDYINKILLEQYNLELTDLKNSLNDDEDGMQIGGMTFIYEDGYFLRLNGGGGYEQSTIIKLLDSYTATKDELIIYEYAANHQKLSETFEEINSLVDYRNGKKIDLTNTCNDSQTENNCALNILKQQKNTYTKYKHTFKKNKTGYYWTKTEVA